MTVSGSPDADHPPSRDVTSPADERGGLIHRYPLSVRPPYDVPDRTFDGLTGDEWRRARRLDRWVALCEPLEGLEVTDYEHTVLEHLAGADNDTVGVVAALLWRARQASPHVGVEDGGRPVMPPALPGHPDDLPTSTTGTPVAERVDQVAADLTALGVHWRGFVARAARLRVLWSDRADWHDVVVLLDDVGRAAATLVHRPDGRWVRLGWSNTSRARVWRSGEVGRGDR